MKGHSDDKKASLSSLRYAKNSQFNFQKALKELLQKIVVGLREECHLRALDTKEKFWFHLDISFLPSSN